MFKNVAWPAVGLLVLLSLIWGTSFILMKQGLKVFSPDELGALRITAASLVFLPVALFHIKKLHTRHVAKLWFSGMIGIFIPAFLFALAQTRLTSSVTGILNSLTPLITLLVGVFFYQQRFRGGSLLGIVLGLVGTVLLVMTKSGNGVNGFNAFGLLVLVACILYSFNLNFIKYKIADLKALTITSISLFLIFPFAAVYLFVFSGFLGKVDHSPEFWTAFGFVVLLGMMSTSLATIIFNVMVKMASPLFASSVTYLIPIVAVAWGLWDGEELLAGHILGMVAIIGGVYLANYKRG